MADLQFMISMANKMNQKKENYQDEDKSKKKTVENFEISLGGGSSSLFSLALFAIAFYLSWSCNSNTDPNMSLPEKIIRAVFAGIFSFFYIIIYFLSWSSQCRKK